MQDIVCLILGGGRGASLYPLTKHRSQPAVPIAGKYRLIDIPLSNCINSGLQRLYVLTQFLSVSLHRHIANTYKFDPFSNGFVEVLAAQQTNEGRSGIVAPPTPFARTFAFWKTIPHGKFSSCPPISFTASISAT